MRHLTLVAVLLTHPVIAAPARKDVTKHRAAGMLTPKEQLLLTIGTVWKTLYHHSWDPYLVEFFVDEYDRKELPPNLAWVSIANFGYASRLNPKMSFRQGGMWARGLTDSTQHNGPREAFADIGTWDLLKARPSIRNDVLECLIYAPQADGDPWKLRRIIFVPKSPNGARARAEERKWRRIETRHIEVLRKAQQR